ncbi:MAG: hypothetical protein Q8N88_04770 [Nanoarchaeota archaeon]|nr:hypothetical protein [Nanoarchaeota archaeon]
MKSVVLGTIVAIIVILFSFLFVLYFSSRPALIENPSANEITQGIGIEGKSFCKKVENEYRETCLVYAYIDEAKEEGDVEVCYGLENPQACIDEVVLSLTVEKYKQGENDTSLCKYISHTEKRIYCENPEIIVDNKYKGFNYG